MELNDPFEVIYSYAILRVLYQRLSVNDFENSIGGAFSLRNLFKAGWQLAHVKPSDDDGEEDGKDSPCIIDLIGD